MTSRTRCWSCMVALITAATMLAVAGRSARAQEKQPAAATPLPAWQIKEHINRDWLRDTITHGLMDYWVKNSVAPNGFIEENLDRDWKPWGTQKEATINGQGRVLVSMALVYEMNDRSNKEYLDAINRSANFMLTKMHDPQYGGFYLRVGEDGHVIQDNKTGFQSFALYSLATAGRVTGNKNYLDAAMTLFRVIRDKMTVNGLFGSGGDYTRDWKSIPGGFGDPGARARFGFVDAMGWSSGNPPNTSGTGFGAMMGGQRPVHCIDLHMFEALMNLYRTTRSPEVWNAVNGELASISKLYDYKLGYLPNCYTADWKPALPPTANPGHFLFEWASELNEAVYLGADPKYLTLGNRIIDLGISKTYDPAIGGLGAYNAKGQPQPMLWWPQCEVVKATGIYAMLHGREDLWPYFHETLDFIRTNYFDTKDGGWFEWYLPGKTRAEQGPRAFYKGSVDGPEWSTYHQVMLFHELWEASDPNYKPWPRNTSK